MVCSIPVPVSLHVHRTELLGAFRNCEKRQLTTICPSVCPSARSRGTTLLPLEEVSLNFIIEDFFENPSIQLVFYLNLTRISEVLHIYMVMCGLCSSVGIATDYGLDGPRSNPGGDKIFRPSRPVLGPTQPPVKWVPVLSRVKVRPGPAADHSPPSSAAVIEE